MNRSKADKLWIFGRHAVVAAIESSKREVYTLMITKNAHEELKSAALISADVNIEIADPNRITTIVGKDAVHQGYAALVSGVEKVDIKILAKMLQSKKRSMIIALDQITDPQNVGAIIRSAVAFGVDGMIVTKDNAVIDSPSLAKASSGGIEEIQIVSVANLVMALRVFKEDGYWIVGLDGSSTNDSIRKISEYDKVVIVMGSEGSGLRRLTQTNCDLMLKIPMVSAGKMESLNVSNAAAIAMFSHCL